MSDAYADRAEERFAFVRRTIRLYPRTWLFQHYKGGIYEILATGDHQDREEELVAYRHLWPHDDPRVKFKTMENFHEIIGTYINEDGESDDLRRFRCLHRP